MTILNLLRKAAEAGVFLSYEAGKLRFRLAVAEFPESLKSEIVARKAELIEFLRSQTCIHVGFGGFADWRQLSI